MSIVTFLQSWVATLRKDEKGASMVEYALLVAGMAAVVVAAVALFGTQITNLINNIDWTP
jgi:pilus assembly protein Flp/PilA